MYKILFSVFTCMISVCAFAPTASMRSGMLERQTLRMGFSDALGAQAPLGFWDPLNILEDATEERFERLRFIEKKHGRISMLAVLGHIVTAAGIRLPGMHFCGIMLLKIMLTCKIFLVRLYNRRHCLWTAVC